MEMVQHSNPFELDVYGKRGLQLERGDGCWLWDDMGKRYLDCMAGIGSVNLGHNHPAVLQALTGQASKLISCPGSFYNSSRLTYLRHLIRVAPNNLNRAFLCNSGTEAMEAALKFARVTTGKTHVICAKRGFHGRSLGALSATFHPKYRKPFLPLLPHFHHVSFNHIAQLQEAMTDQVSAVVLELIQGEGGVYPIEQDYLQAARDLCDQMGALLIIDEVQTGFGRTGALFALEHFPVRADILCLAKSIANGLPMGATLVGPAVAVKKGQHGSTFGGNPLACAVAHKVLEELESQNIPQRAKRLGDAFTMRLMHARWPLVRQIRGKGLMIGLELKTRVQPILTQLQKEGILALSAGATVLRLLPPLTITQEELDILFERLDQILSATPNSP